MASPVRLDAADRLILLRRLDRFRKWQSLDDRRFCRCCHKLISGRQIEVIDASPQDDVFRLACPTTNCLSDIEDWVSAMKLRNHQISGDVASFASLIEMGKDLSSAESRAVIPDNAFTAIRGWFTDSRLMLAHFTSKSSPPRSSQFYRCQGCNELVDGSQLSEVLLHHQHVLDSYRIRIMRGLDAAWTRPTQTNAKG